MRTSTFLCLVAVGATFFLSGQRSLASSSLLDLEQVPPQTAAKLIVDQATWGPVEGPVKDVTALVRGMVVDDRLNFIVTASQFGADPVDKPKYLKVKFTWGGVKGSRNVLEGKRLNIQGTVAPATTATPTTTSAPATPTTTTTPTAPTTTTAPTTPTTTTAPTTPGTTTTAPTNPSGGTNTNAGAAGGGTTTGGQAADKVVNGLNATSVIYKRGDEMKTFQKVSAAAWNEIGPDGKVIDRLNEVGRDEWSIYLFSPAYKQSLAVDLFKKVVTDRDAGDKEFGTVIGANADPIPTGNDGTTAQGGADPAAGVNGKNVTKVICKNGDVLTTFLQVDAKAWKESNMDGSVLGSFNETGRDEWSVYLTDPSRGTTVTLDLHRKEAQYKSANGTVDINTIGAANADPLAGDAGGTASGVVVNGQNATKVVYRIGEVTTTFLQISEKAWAQNGPDGTRISEFKEDSRDEWSIYLSDPATNAAATIDLFKKEVAFKAGGVESPLGTVIAATAEALPTAGPGAAAVVNGINATKVVFHKGEEGRIFQQTGPLKWEEQYMDGRTINDYTELDRDEWSIYLKGPEQDPSLAIDLFKKTIALRDGDHAQIGTVVLATADPIPVAPAPPAPTDEDGILVNGMNATKVVYMSNDATHTLLQIDRTTWKEKNPDGEVINTFSEETRDEWTVYLKDASRERAVNLDLFRMEVLFSAGADAGFLGPIIGKLADPLPEPGTGTPPSGGGGTATASVNGLNVTLVVYTNGEATATFFQVGATAWKEKDANGNVTNSFAEIGRDEWSVYLEDHSRDMKVGLDLYKKETWFSDATNSGVFGRITNATAEPLPEVTEAPATDPGREPGVIMAERVSKVVYKNGDEVKYFSQLSATAWKETRADGSVIANFDEEYRDEWTIYLFDASRAMQVTLDLYTKNVTFYVTDNGGILGYIVGVSTDPVPYGGATTPATGPGGSTNTGIPSDDDPGLPPILTDFNVPDDGLIKLSDVDAELVMSWIGIEVAAAKVEYCYRQSYHRDDGSPLSVCPAGEEKQGLLCYPTCRAGFYGVLDRCWQNSCPPGFRDDPLSCYKLNSTSRTPYPLTDCPAGMESDGAALCYPVCRSGYSGASFLCWQHCPSGFSDDGATTCWKPAFSGYTRGGPYEPSINCPSGYREQGTGGAKYCWNGVAFPPWDVDLTYPGSYCPGRENIGGYCYDYCRSGYTVEATWGCALSCPSGMSSNGGLGCIKGTYPRKASSKICAPGREEVTPGWCYAPCPPGTHGVLGLACSMNCPAPMTEGGIFCHKDNYYRTEGSPMQCAPGTERDGGFCYTPCRPGFHGVANYCWQNCPSTQPVNCGAGCSSDELVCFETTAEMVTSVLDMIVNIATLGEGSAATAAKNSAKVAMKEAVVAAKAGQKAAATAAAKRSAAAMKTYARECAKGFQNLTTRKVAKKIKEDFTEGASQWIMEEYATINLKIEMREEFSVEDLRDLAGLDPTGVAGVVSAYTHQICPDEHPFPTLSKAY